MWSIRLFLSISKAKELINMLYWRWFDNWPLEVHDLVWCWRDKNRIVLFFPTYMLKMFFRKIVNKDVGLQNNVSFGDAYKWYWQRANTLCNAILWRPRDLCWFNVNVSIFISFFFFPNLFSFFMSPSFISYFPDSSCVKCAVLYSINWRYSFVPNEWMIQHTTNIPTGFRSFGNDCRRHGCSTQVAILPLSSSWILRWSCPTQLLLPPKLPQQPLPPARTC